MATKSYRLLSGELVDLAGLAPREAAFLADLRKMSQQGVSYFEVYRTALGPGSPALSGRSRVDRQLADSPLYRAAEDIATRAGIEQGLVLAPEHEPLRATAPADASMISVAQAADLIGVSRAAVYKAIDRGALRTLRIGNVTVVERASAETYRGRRASEVESEEAAPPRQRRARAATQAASRSPSSTEATILEVIKAHPGIRTEEIEKHVRMPKRTLDTGLRRLRETGKVKTRQVRGQPTYASA